MINTIGSVGKTSTPLTARKGRKNISIKETTINKEKSVGNLPSSSKFVSITNDEDAFYDADDEAVHGNTTHKQQSQEHNIDDHNDDSVTFKNPIDEENFIKTLENYPTQVQSFIYKYHQQPKEIDKTYGLKYNSDTDSWTIGSSKVEFLPSGDISVLGRTYKGTQGLYELLFFKHPLKNYAQTDERAYGDILQKTNAYRRDFSPHGKVIAPNSYKYQNYIKSAISIGRGLSLLECNEKTKQYVYYDDVNELIDRLIKLDASYQAGNTNNINEIMSILEELTELGVIVPIN